MNLITKQINTELFGFYDSLLSKKEYKYLYLFLVDDFSISEIAENKKISRQAVSNRIKYALRRLNKFEEKLHLRENYLQRRKIEDQLIIKPNKKLIKKLINLEEE